MEEMELLKNSLSQSLQDFVMSRSERKQIRRELGQAKLDDHQKQVLWSEVHKLALEQADQARSETLIEWVYECGKLLRNTETDAGGSKVYFSPGTGCREAICSRIRYARKQIRICVFTISDDEISEELLLSHRLGKDIRIITDNDKTADLGSDIDRLALAGIQVVEDRTRVHMHHKFALFDDDYLLTGSYNWTRSAADHNYENVIVLQDAKAFKAYEREFERLWRELG